MNLEAVTWCASFIGAELQSCSIQVGADLMTNVKKQGMPMPANPLPDYKLNGSF